MKEATKKCLSLLSSRGLLIDRSMLLYFFGISILVVNNFPCSIAFSANMKCCQPFTTRSPTPPGVCDCPTSGSCSGDDYEEYTVGCCSGDVEQDCVNTSSNCHEGLIRHGFWGCPLHNCVCQFFLDSGPDHLVLYCPCNGTPCSSTSGCVWH